MELRPLSELSEWQLVDPNQDLRGRAVIDESGRSHGAVVELLVDTDNERIASVRTETGRLIPVEPLEIRGSKVLFHDRSGTGPACCGHLQVRQCRETDDAELRTGKQLRHGKIEAVDGDIGSLRDVYFDDRSWRTRYLVIDTAKWLFGRKVLISPEAILPSEAGFDAIRLNLTRDQIRHSPSWDTDPPVSRQYEGVLHNYYGWGAATIPPGAAIGAPLVAGAPYDVVVAPAAVDVQRDSRSADYDEHLRSMKEVVGYELTGKDGSIGYIGDFAFEFTIARVHALIVFANRIPEGPVIRVPVDKVIAIDWATAEVKTTFTRHEAITMPEWNDERS